MRIVGLFGRKRKGASVRQEQVRRLKRADRELTAALGEEDTKDGDPDAVTRLKHAEAVLAAARRNATEAEITTAMFRSPE